MLINTALKQPRRAVSVRPAAVSIKESSRWTNAKLSLPRCATGLHKGGVFQVAAEDGVANINNNGLCCLGVNNGRHMDVQHPLPRVIRPMDLYEVGLEVIRNGLVFIRSFTIRRDVFGNSDAPCQFLLQQIGFIQEKDEVDVLQQLVRTYL